jgi:hypothetical protein
MSSLDDVIQFDATFKSPWTYIAAGPSQSGKSTHVFNFLKYRHQLMDKPTDRIFYFYNQWQPAFTDFQREGIVTEWINQLPTTELLKEKAHDVTNPTERHSSCICVIDDYMSEVNDDIGDLFTVLSHAYGINVIFLTQNVFAKKPVFRTISLNATYISIFKNPRDSSQITNYAKQFAPGNTKYVVQAYRECTRRPWSYILFDHHQSTPNKVRVRSGVLPHELMKIWIPT